MVPVPIPIPMVQWVPIVPVVPVVPCYRAFIAAVSVPPFSYRELSPENTALQAPGVREWW